jgi:hypothetical protein
MFTFLGTLFAIGTIWFWLLLFIDFCIITALVENESGVWATIVFLGSLFGLNFLWKLPIIDSVKANPGHTALLILSYFAIGVVWSIVKWYFFVHNKMVKYNDYKAKFLAENNATELTPELAVKLVDTIAGSPRRYSGYNDSEGVSAKPPLASENKSRLTRWGTYWPFSIVGTLLNDVVRRTWEYIYEMLQTTYQRMSEAIFKSATADVKMAEEHRAKAAAANSNTSTDTRMPQARDWRK